MKKILFMLIIALAIPTMLVSQTPDATTINEGLNQFVEDFSASVLNATINQNVYADAYIGKLLPSLPPHFAIGFNTSFAMTDMTGLQTAGNQLGITNIPETFALPYMAADIRIGGLFLPFDIGFTFMKMPSLSLFDIETDYMTWGADLRYALMEQSTFKPAISLGVGYYQSSGNLKVSDSGSSVSLAYKTNILTISAQISKTFFGIITPFFAGRFVMADADTGYDWNVYSLLEGSGSYKKSFAELNQFNIYGGLSVNIFILRLTPSVSYDFTNEIFSGALSARIQI
ncbi:MAG: hypothetical protein R3Y36_04780 [Spirochaetales bacterium]